MQKTQLNVRLDADVIRKLNATADRYGMTANTILSAAACELARVRSENLWHALGRIAAGEGADIMAPEPERLPEPKKRLRQALTV